MSDLVFVGRLGRVRAVYEGFTRSTCFRSRLRILTFTWAVS